MRNPFERFWFANDPEATFWYAMVSLIVISFFRGHPIAMAVIVVGFFFWPTFFRLVRGAFIGLRVGARRTAVGRVRGSQYCPQCGAALEAVPAHRAGPHQYCPDCRGRWVPREPLMKILESSKSPIRPWRALDAPREGGSFPCPACAAPMKRGTFPGARLDADLCEACGRLWLDHKDWIFLELTST